MVPLAAEMLAERGWRYVIALLFLTCVTLIYFIAFEDRLSKGQIVVTTHPVKLRYSPTKGHNNRIASIPKGFELVYVDKGWRKFRFLGAEKVYFDYWRKVRLNNGLEGWIYGAYLNDP
ncbi:MAG: SH3 domain-containing protein [Desulfobacteraceae bacterium]|nr:SH3 domain-containing protein [Desulfobacteraceae bacterium]